MVSDAGNSRRLSADVFGDLPDALINELLVRSTEVAERAAANVSTHITERDELRDRAQRLGIIARLDEMPESPDRSVVAVDGSLALFRLASFDLVATAALAVNGLRSPIADTRLPYKFDVRIPGPVARANEIAYALMFCMEYEVASEVESELVLLDGAFSTGMVAISLALRSASDLRDSLSDSFNRRWTDSVIDIVPELLVSDRVIAIPKRTSSNEFMSQTRLFQNREVDTNGRSTASLILEGGEYAGPFALETHGFFLDASSFYRRYTNDLLNRYSDISVVYFKPTDWAHAFRIELPPTIGRDKDVLHQTLELVRRQTASPALMEPYPLYVADRFAKSLNKGVSAILDATRSKVVRESENPEIAIDMLNAYRTDVSFEEPAP